VAAVEEAAGAEPALASVPEEEEVVVVGAEVEVEVEAAPASENTLVSRRAKRL
jgi:hypothetical protein